MKKIFFFILSILLINSLFDNSPNFQEIENFSQIQQAIVDSDHLISLFFYNTYDCTKCSQTEPTIDRFSDDMQGLIKFYHIDCDKVWDDNEMKEKFPICNPRNVKELPQLVFYSPPERRIDPKSKTPIAAKEYVYTGEVSVKAISKFASGILPSYRELLGGLEELKGFLGFGNIRNKVILFTDREETPTLYRGLTAQFRDKILVKLIKF